MNEAKYYSEIINGLKNIVYTSVPIDKKVNMIEDDKRWIEAFLNKFCSIKTIAWIIGS